MIYLIRHADTEWTDSDRHTSFTDIGLTEKGRQQTLWLKRVLENRRFKKVLCSPLKRAKETCRITGFMQDAELDKDLVEWNYGEYEGKTKAEILAIDPTWTIFKKGTPGGESPQDILVRTRNVIAKIQHIEGDVLIFSHGHFLRGLATQWIHAPLSLGENLMLSTAALSLLTEQNQTPVILLWNASGQL